MGSKRAGGGDLDEEDEDNEDGGMGGGMGIGTGGGDLLDTPAVEKKRYGEDLETPRKRPGTGTGRTGASAGAAGNKGVTLTLRDQEKVRALLISSHPIPH